MVAVHHDIILACHDLPKTGTPSRHSEEARKLFVVLVHVLLNVAALDIDATQATDVVLLQVFFELGELVPSSGWHDSSSSSSSGSRGCVVQGVVVVVVR